MMESLLLVAMYSVQEISNFWQSTKFKHNVKIDDYFPNAGEFIRNAKYYMKAFWRELWFIV